MEIGHPDIAEFGLLVPHVEHVIACPHAVRLAQAQAFADTRDRGKADPALGLMGFVLDFDFDHGAALV